MNDSYLETQGERLRQSRIDAGFDTATEAAKAFGWNPSTYTSNENGTRTFPMKKARQYARAFRVDANWLFDGETHGMSDQPSRYSGNKNASPGENITRVAMKMLQRGKISEEKFPVVLEKAKDFFKEEDINPSDDQIEIVLKFWLSMDN